MNNTITYNHAIQNKIFTVRGLQIMIDRDLAELYGVETRVLKQAVKRNIERFPSDFMFEATNEDIDFMVSQSVIPSKQHLGGAKPFLFTEHGVANLSSVLTSKIAIEINIKIIRAFVDMRKLISSNQSMFERFERIEERLSIHNENFNKIFDAIEDKTIKPKQGIFYDGQIFDAYAFISDLIKSAKSTITLFDNYVDESVLTLLSKNQTVKITIYTKQISKQLKLDVEKYNSQYKQIELERFDLSHDRFLLIDDEVYHIGASLKDLGKKWFAFSKMNRASFEIIERLK
ncbi:MAG: DNA-binding protein [Sulfurimonas sp. RIFOXYD12_FULL_33_39]|uniref:ORF6N domain-containing protein n=1 Tax=unclassified Sulfurimonas TaxID=2623549 RepID=UPI0008AAD389|nr:MULTISPECIES: ORF6N domain-containing protein [unclassified Sulfurimonas]OHE09826.1 MAG: DNA-binding protein [Sulfurimonas sp. RIFOXYD12_FULL_33_39]OHE13666.1 MAG: DNA-binding protein [Sulfurimonas sp. RIFOXYD2_FULL_34_21]DAB28126.1 MAG TPA: DNA-binding protein [Sulfurimonas sp. UBA10385]